MILTRANLTFDTWSGVLRAETFATASPKQARLLQALMAVAHPVSRDLLMDRIMAGSPDSCLDGVLDVQVCRLRKKLRRIGALVRIACVWGRGFIMEPVEPAGASVSMPMELLRQAIALARRHDVALAARLEQVEG